MAEKVLTTVELPVELHRRIKGYAGKHGGSMKDLMVLGLYSYMDTIEDPKNLERELESANIK